MKESGGVDNAGSGFRLSILIPVRNEGLNLKILLRILRAVVDVPHEVLVVYDCPEDDSVPVIAGLQKEYTNLRAVCNMLGRGVVNAIRAGVTESTGEYILIFAADEMGPVLAIEDMLALMEQGCDFVSCTRYAHGGRRLGGSLTGRFLSRWANFLFYQLGGSAFTDATTGIKMFRRAVFDRLSPKANPVGWAVTFEMAIKAQLAGLRLGEVPIISIDRLYGGQSSFQMWPWLVEYLRWFLWGWVCLRRASKGKRTSAEVRVPLALLMANR